MNDNVPPRLYKYTEFEGAQSILMHMSFRWRSVLEFNDPFENSLEFEDLHGRSEAALLWRVNQILGSSEEPVLQQEGKELGNALLTARNQFKNKEVSLQEAVNYVMGTEGSNMQAEESLIDGVRATQEEIKVSSRVLCLSEAPEDLLMWAHYAQSHEGAVYEIDVRADKCFGTPERMEYSKKRTPFMSAEQLADNTLGLQPLDELYTRMASFARSVLRTKSDHWEYEQEWRCSKSADMTESITAGELYSDLKFEPGAITRIVLGCRMSEENREIITKLAREKLGDIPIVQAKLNPSLFKLDIPDE